ncbi:MAG: TonB-dependent receptor [Gammaproteobacteria bacterium]|nr:TonB-dependent receptor [Gammaproteobacteria bacterium]
MKLYSVGMVSASLALLGSPSFALAVDNEKSLIIIGSKQQKENLEIEPPKVPHQADIGDAFAKLPGASINKNGEVTTLAQYRGHIGRRTLVQLDGQSIISAGPNLMDSPFSYVNTLWVEHAELSRGIAPVSSGRETLGSAVNLSYWQPEFSSEAHARWEGKLDLGFTPEQSARALGTRAGWSNQHHRLHFLGALHSSDDWTAAEGVMRGSEYDKRAQLFGYGSKLGQHQFDISQMRQDIGVSGTPVLPMDIIFVDGDRTSLEYSYAMSTSTLALRAFAQRSEHLMNNFTLRMPMNNRTRQTLATGEGHGTEVEYRWKANETSFLVGLDAQAEQHSAIISDPNQPNFRVVNFNDVERRDYSAYFEAVRSFNERHKLTFAARSKYVEQQADAVEHSMAMMAPIIAQVQMRFNASLQPRSFTSFDWSLNHKVTQTEQLSWFWGVASKTRAPSYQELFLWVPMQATGGLGDGNVYIGDPDLDNETSYQLEIGFDYSNNQLTFSPGIYYHHLHDYIQGVQSNDPMINMVASMMGANEVFQFQNVPGKIYGFDTLLEYRLNADWKMTSQLTVIRGQRSDINEPLYRIVPDNISWQWQYQTENLSSYFELRHYRSQSRVASSLEEDTSASYTVMNAELDWTFANNASLVIGVENLLNSNYQSHLAGVNRTAMNLVAVGERVPGKGRTIYLSSSMVF